MNRVEAVNELASAYAGYEITGHNVLDTLMQLANTNEMVTNEVAAIDLIAKDIEENND